MKYFIDEDIWYQGKQQPKKKVYLQSVVIEPNGEYATCYDEDGDQYRLRVDEIKDEEKEGI